MAFAKGVSGNPGGRPKAVVEVRHLARDLTAKAFAELERIAFTSPDDRARLAAVGMILDRAWGKPTQPVDGNGEGGPVMLQIAWLPSEGADRPTEPES